MNQEMTPEKKAAIVEEYRYWNVDNIDWWDSIHESFTEDMADKGITVENIYFTGFGSQGDGACFEGYVSNWGLFLKSLGYDNPTLIAHARNYWAFGVKHSGFYYHENCTWFDYDLVNPYGMPEHQFIEQYSPFSDDFRNAAWLAVLERFDYDKLEDEFIEEFKNHMRQLYSDLKDEYAYLTSDEAVWEALKANEVLE